MIITRMIQMPDCGVDGFTILDANGDYNIYINDKLSPSGRLETYKHEKRHIENRDFERFDVQQIEIDVRR